jgi:hypothetical protein
MVVNLNSIREVFGITISYRKLPYIVLLLAEIEG